MNNFKLSLKIQILNLFFIINVHGQQLVIDKPVSFLEKKVGIKNHIHFNNVEKKLSIESRPYVSADEKSVANFIYSNIEVLTKDKKLIKRFVISAYDTNQISQKADYYFYEHDTVIIKTWGFAYNFYEDSLNNQRMLVGSTPVLIKQYPQNE